MTCNEWATMHVNVDSRQRITVFLIQTPLNSQQYSAILLHAQEIAHHQRWCHNVQKEP